MHQHDSRMLTVTQVFVTVCCQDARTCRHHLGPSSIPRSMKEQCSCIETCLCNCVGGAIQQAGTPHRACQMRWPDRADAWEVIRRARDCLAAMQRS